MGIASGLYCCIVDINEITIIDGYNLTKFNLSEFHEDTYYKDAVYVCRVYCQYDTCRISDPIKIFDNLNDYYATFRNYFDVMSGFAMDCTGFNNNILSCDVQLNPIKTSKHRLLCMAKVINGNKHFQNLMLIDWDGLKPKLHDFGGIDNLYQIGFSAKVTRGGSRGSLMNLKEMHSARQLTETFYKKVVEQ